MLKFLSNNKNVIPPASTGKDNNNKKAVINTAHTNKGILCNDIPGALIFNTVAMKFMAPSIDEIPDKCKLNIAKSTAPPLCDPLADSGGYTVQPTPGPASTNAEANNKSNDGINNQKLILFNLG